MKNLKKVLDEFSLEAPGFGDEVTPSSGGAQGHAVATAPSIEEINRLRSNVQEVSKRNKSYFNVCFALLIILFVGAVLLVVFSLPDPRRIQGVLAASGISFFGIVTQMLKLWKEKVASDLTLALVMSLKPEDIKNVIDIILRGLR